MARWLRQEFDGRRASFLTGVSELASPGPLLEIKGDLACYSDTLRVNGEGWRSELVLLSMFGPRNAVRAAWATLSKVSGRNKHHDAITVGGTNVAKAANAHYSMVSAPLERGLLHCVLWHQQLGHNAPDLGHIYQGGPNAKDRYFARLARRCPVPMRASWCAPLWDIGRERGAIAEVRGHGREVWRVDTTRDVWEPIIHDAIAEGGLR